MEHELRMRKRDSPMSMSMSMSQPPPKKRIKKEDEAAIAHVPSFGLWEMSKAEDEEKLEQLAKALHQGRFREIQVAMENLTRYDDPSISIYTLGQLLYPITGPLTQSLLRAQASTAFNSWLLDRIQTCFENANELYQEDIEIIIPLFSYETNNYGSTILDRLVALLPKTFKFNSSIAVWIANRMWEADEELTGLRMEHKKLVVAGVSASLGLVFARDDRFDTKEEEEEEEEEEESRDKKANLELPQRRVPALTGEDLVSLTLHCFQVGLHDAFRGMLLRMDWSLCLFNFDDFLRIHMPFLKIMLPILPQHGIPYSDFSLVQFCQAAMFAFLHQCVGREPRSGGEEWRQWDQRRRRAEVVLKEMDQTALREILGRQYEGTISMQGIRRQERDMLKQSVEREGA